ncbi:Winged helix-turn-helix DNA-binding [Lachnospiraceae bacterium NE2001]|nr:Winged helix-turn-helix DNA-binding [Lachnospiraceae bacterium NE2001]
MGVSKCFLSPGYIERWGRGIEKICDACKELGTELPVYELRGNSLRVHFKALQSALIKDSKVSKDQSDTMDDTLGDTLADKIIVLIKENPRIKQEEIAEAVKVSVPSVKRTMKILSDKGRIVRKDGKRYGYWEVN